MPPPPPPPCQLLPTVEGASAACDVADEAASAQAKRLALQRKGAAALIAAEEYARRFESPDVGVSAMVMCVIWVGLGWV